MQIYIGGSRHYHGQSPALVAELLHAGSQVHVGCCVGADQAVIQLARRSSSFDQVRVFAAFGCGGEGSIPTLSAVSTVQAWARAGGQVIWLAGGGLHHPLAARLIKRSLAALRGCMRAVFVEPGLGSLAVAGHAVTSGTITYAIASQAPGSPAGCAGRWVEINLLGHRVWLWRPAQLQLF